MTFYLSSVIMISHLTNPVTVTIPHAPGLLPFRYCFPLPLLTSPLKFGFQIQFLN